MENTENQYLGKEKISKLLFKFSIPCVLSLLISALYNIVDQIFIGNSEIGYLGNAATSVVFPITVITVAFAWMFGDGSAAFLSICQGRKDTRNIHRAVGNSLLITTLCSIILVVLGFTFMTPLLYLFGASDTSIGLAQSYFTIIIAFVPAYMIANTLSAIIRADGSPAFSMIATAAGAVTNIILDPLFIFGFKWGIEGAAWATIIGQVLSLILSVAYLFKSRTFRLQLASFKFDFRLFGNVLKLGVSTFITQMSIVIISLVCNIMLAQWGARSRFGADIPIATIGICMKVFTIVINLVIGIILGAQPILGYNIGAGKNHRVRETFRKVILTTIAIGAVSTFIFEVFPDVVIRLFGTSDALYMEFARLTFRIFLLLITFTCSIKVISIFFQAVGEPLKATIVSLTRDIVCFVPLVILLPQFMGVEGALWAAPVADIIGITIAVALTWQFFRHLGQQNSKN